MAKISVQPACCSAGTTRQTNSCVLTANTLMIYGEGILDNPAIVKKPLKSAQNGSLLNGRIFAKMVLML